jgi:hypothetical protein
MIVNGIKDEYNIDSIPRFLFFENGKLIHEQKGASDKDTFNFTIKNKLLKLTSILITIYQAFPKMIR